MAKINVNLTDFDNSISAAVSDAETTLKLLNEVHAQVLEHESELENKSFEIDIDTGKLERVKSLMFGTINYIQNELEIY